MKATAQIIRGDGNDSGTNGENGDEQPLLTSMKHIEKLNSELIEVTKHLPVCLGSVFKIDSLSYPNWGFAVNEDNIDDIRRSAEFYYKKDYLERRQNKGLESILQSDFQETQEKRMVEFIAVTMRELMRSMDDGKREFHICDIPARDGRLSAAIAHALRRESETKDILKRTIFHIVDISGQKLDKAEEILNQFRAKSNKCITEDEVLFKQQNPGSYDFIVSLSHLHHKPFLVNYLKEMNRVLSDNGALLIADWHSPLCSHPAYVLSLLQNLGVGSARLDMFREIMEIQLATERKPLEKDELESLMNHISHWKSVMRSLEENPPRLPSRLYINAAYDTGKQRKKKLEDSEFTINLDDVRKAFPKCRLPLFSDSTPDIASKRLVSGSDSALVMIAKKK